MKRLLIIFLFAVSVQADDLREIIDRQLAAGKTEVVIAPGTYRVTPQNKMHLNLFGLSSITIIADNVEMICTETTRALTIENCTNLTIRGLTIDYDPLPYTQGRIVSISDDRMVHEIELSDGYPRADIAHNVKYAIFKPDTRTLRYGEYYTFRLDVRAPDRLHLIKSEMDREKKGGEQIGDLVVVAVSYAPGGSQPHAVFCSDSVNTVLENITLYSSPMFGFFESHCDGSVYRGCKIDRRSPETDLMNREPRLRSLNADAYHSKFAKKGPQIIGCSARWQGDDCVNICGAYHLITKVDGKTLRVLAKQKMDIQPGDPVELVAEDGKRIPDAIVVSVKPAGSATAEEKGRLKSLELLPRIRGFLKDAYEIKLDHEVDIPFGSVIASMNRMGNGFSVKDCIFGNNRSRGILIKASDGEISGNRIVNCGMQAIKISPEYQWLESGCSRDVEIKNNTIMNSGREAIQVHAFGDYPAHEHIQILGNTIRSDFDPPIYIGGVNGGVVSCNTIERMDGRKVDVPVVLEHCENVRRMD